MRRCGATLGDLHLDGGAVVWRPRALRQDETTEHRDHFAAAAPDGLPEGSLDEFDAQRIVPQAYCTQHGDFFIAPAVLREAMDGQRTFHVLPEPQ